jgi:mono/diheme cytochrome c family protein
MRRRTIVCGLLLASLAACTRRGDSLLVEAEDVCVTGGVADPDPVYRRVNEAGASNVVQRILNVQCASCHGAVKRMGAPSHFRLDCYDSASTGCEGDALGALEMAAGICVMAVQANPDSPIRMPFTASHPPLCDSDRETLRTWINRGAPREGSPPPLVPEPCARREDLRCETKTDVPAQPAWDEHVRPILSRRCVSCHSSPSLFAAQPQPLFVLSEETFEHDSGERLAGAFEVRGEIVRTAVSRLPQGPEQLVPPMPYQPPYGGRAVDVVPPLCDADKEVLRRWATRGRRSGSTADLPLECVTETVPVQPTWERDVGRIFAARCGLCHGPRDRAGQGLRLDLYSRENATGSPGVADAHTVCRTVQDGVRADELSVPIETGSCAGAATGRRIRTERVIDLVELVALSSGAYMPYGMNTRLPGGERLREPLCDNDQRTIVRWRSQGMRRR